MSQSDFIKFKRTERLLRDQTKFEPVLTPSEYTAYMNFNLETTVTNDKQTNNQLIPSDRQIVFGMEKNICDGYTEFLLCSGTQDRANRRNLDASQSSCFPVMKAPERSVPRTYALQKDTLNNTFLRKYYRNICEYKDVPCVGSQSRVCRLKYGKCVC